MDDQLRIWEDEGGRANPVAEELMKEDELPETFQQQMDVARDRQERAMRWHGEEVSRAGDANYAKEQTSSMRVSIRFFFLKILD